MKTIRAIKGTKDVKLGEIRRVDDKTAHNMVGSLWQYISKSEWKKSTTEQVTDQVEKKKNPKQDLPDDGKEFVKTRKKSKNEKTPKEN
jgi:hypothetical protein